MALEIVSRGNAVPNAAGGGVLGQTLAKRRKFRCHWMRSEGGKSAHRDDAGQEERPSGNDAT